MAAKKRKKISKETSKRSRNAPANNAEESKAQKFTRLGSMRATKAINAMRALQKLANRNNYEFTQEQVNKLVDALKTEVEGVFNSFNTTGGETKETFSL